MNGLFDYLKSVLPELPEFGDGEKFKRQLLESAGYDESTVLLEDLRNVSTPVVIVEESADGSITRNDGFMLNEPISLWVMEQAREVDRSGRRAALQKAFELGRKIIALLNRDAEREYADHSETFITPAGAIDFSRTPYFKRMGIGHGYYGYEFQLTFRDNLDLTVEHG